MGTGVVAVAEVVVVATKTEVATGVVAEVEVEAASEEALVVAAAAGKPAGNTFSSHLYPASVI